jgi:hypothetical protein
MLWQVLTMTEGGDEEFYKNFQAIGYNKALQLDEAATFSISLATSDLSLITTITTKPHNGSRAFIDCE